MNQKKNFSSIVYKLMIYSIEYDIFSLILLIIIMRNKVIGTGTSCKGQLANYFFQTGFFRYATINLLSLKRIRDSDLKTIL